jgi:streptogramin lyase
MIRPHPKNEVSHGLVHLSLAILVLVGCSFDASKLRRPASRDALPPSDAVAQPDDTLPDSQLLSDGPTGTGGPEARPAYDSPTADAAVAPDVPADSLGDAAESESGGQAPDGVGSNADGPEDTAATDDVENPSLDSIGDDAPALSNDTGGAGGAPGTGGALGTGGELDDGGAGGAATGGAGGTTASDARNSDTRPDTGPPNAVTEYPIGPGHSQPWLLTFGSPTELWIAEHTSGKIVRFTPADKKVKDFQAVPTGTTIEGLAWGPDNNLWFTEYSADKIARMTPTGEVTEFSVTRGSGPDALTVGQDGLLWFTEMTGNRIGSISVSGTVSEYDVNTINSQPARIAAAPDGNLWFTEYNASRIGRLNPSAPTPTVSWATRTPFASPSGITIGADGNVWFYETNTNQIGRMTTTGVVDEFRVPTASLGATRGGMTLGPDNNVWFTEYSASKIGRITPAGVISEFATNARNAGPFSIIAGPDGNLWFVEADANKIASIAP